MTLLVPPDARKVIASPKTLFNDVYGWGSTFDYRTFIYNVATLLGGFGLPVRVVPPSDQLLDKYYDAQAPVRPTMRVVRAPVYSSVVASGGALGYLELERLPGYYQGVEPAIVMSRDVRTGRGAIPGIWQWAP